MLIKYNENKYIFLESNFIKYQTILVCLLPFILITGPAISDIVVTILSISYLIYLINSQLRLVILF